MHYSVCVCAHLGVFNLCQKTTVFYFFCYYFFYFTAFLLKYITRMIYILDQLILLYSLGFHFMKNSKFILHVFPVEYNQVYCCFIAK